MKIRKIKGETWKDMEKDDDKILRYPHLGIDLEHLPEAKKWKIGGKYRVILDVNMDGINIDKGVKEESGRASFDIVGIGILPRKNPKKKKIKRYS